MALVKCPICKTEAEWNGNEHRPFCTERCKLIDLGEWIEGGYSLPDTSAGLSDEDMREIERELQKQADKAEEDNDDKEERY